MKPVAAGDPVAGPVVEVFMGDNTLDPLVVSIRSRLRPGQDILGVEHVQPLVFHRPHVEIVNRDDLVFIEVIFQTVGLFIPAHGVLQ